MAKEGIGQVISWYICTVVALLFLVARLTTRYQRLRSLAIDDGLITLAGCCLIGDLVIQQYMWNLGMANIPKASREELIQIMKMIVPGSILYVTSLWAVKIAMVLFYKKLAAPGTRLQLIYNIVLALLVAFWSTIFLNIIFQCYPHDKRWSTDPKFISLPISMVLKLQMKLKLKLGVIAIFALGFFVVIASSPASSVGTKSTRGHYELSSGGHHRSWRTNRGRSTIDVMGGTRSKDNSSEDNLVNDLGAPVASASASTSGKTGEIKVNTTFQVHYGRDDEGGVHPTKQGQF
ncbi:hypothetical protein VCV18_010940 [Metarhizium anisopliae]